MRGAKWVAGGKSASGKSFQRAIASLDRQARLELRVLKQEFLAEGKKLQAEMAEEVAVRTGLPKAQAKRRIRVQKAKGVHRAWVVMRLGRDASIVHAGRLKGVRRRGAKVISIPGVPIAGGAFIMRPAVWKGQKRRIYARGPGGLEAVAHPVGVVDVFVAKATGARVQAMLRAALIRARRRTHGKRTALDRGARLVLGEASI